MKVLAVTSCPSGIVYTYMAAEAIDMACKRAGVECKVETQGSIGIKNIITPEDIETADAVILTTDTSIQNEERFKNMEKFRVSIREAIKQADLIVSRVIDASSA